MRQTVDLLRDCFEFTRKKKMKGKIFSKLPMYGNVMFNDNMFCSLQVLYFVIFCCFHEHIA